MVMKCHEYTAAHGGKGRVVNCEVHVGPAPANTFLKQKGLQLAEVGFQQELQVMTWMVQMHYRVANHQILVYKCTRAPRFVPRKQVVCLWLNYACLCRNRGPMPKNLVLPNGASHSFLV